jgi:hypothetical protein
MPALKALLLLLLTAQLPAQTHTSIHPGLTGENLLSQVVSDYKTTTVLGYGPARDLLYGTIDIKNDSVSGIYSGHKLYLPPGVDPSSHLYMGGIADGINAEHTYPRSKGARDGNGFSDMHHLFPCRVAVNTSRNNFPFAEIDDRQTTSWFYLNQNQSNTPAAVDIDLYSERINGAFEPRESKKGDIARAMIYFFTMYKEEAMAADPDFFEAQRETFCRWHRQDPVDATEWERTFMIAAHQDDLPNPFILDSSLVARAYCESVTAVSEQNDETVLVYPNPVVNVLYVVATGRNRISVTNPKGQVLVEQWFNDKTEIDFSKMIPGTYFIRVGMEVHQTVKH